jgi:hypothetical protein
VFIFVSGFDAMSYAAITPHAYRAYDIRVLGKNIGDGFILRAVERFVGKIDPSMLVPARKTPSPRSLEKLNSAATVLLAGANQLNDHFSPWPGLTAENIRKTSYTFVPMGVGISGKDGGGLDLTLDAKARLIAMHERIAFSSWRCQRTVDALAQNVPEIKDKLLMTCCPVVLDRPLLEGVNFRKEHATIAATVTERDDFWERETSMLERIAKVYPKSRRIMVLHQDFAVLPANRKHGLISEMINNPARKLRSFAKNLGFEVRILRSADEGLALYTNDIDLHFGSRLHAHLLMMSLNKWSFLTYVDERMAGISECLGFPLCNPAHIDDELDYDFEIVRRNAKQHHVTMQKFVASLSST